jgi:hypothetical protein
MVYTVTQQRARINFSEGLVSLHIRGELEMHIADLGDNHEQGRGGRASFYLS